MFYDRNYCYFPVLLLIKVVDSCKLSKSSLRNGPDYTLFGCCCRFNEQYELTACNNN